MTVQNEQRRARGQVEITVTGWAEPPAYDRISRRMAWAVKARSGKEELINARTRVLGREGYLSFNLITEPAAFAHDKNVLAGVLAHVAYTAGKRYEDYQPGTDRDSGKGLADLIAVTPASGGPDFGKLKQPLYLASKVGLVALILGVLFFGRFRRRRVRAPGSNI